MRKFIACRQLLPVTGIISLLLSGCSVSGIGEPDYACQEPGKGVCKSARQVYRDTNSALPEEDPLPPEIPVIRKKQRIDAPSSPEPTPMPAAPDWQPPTEAPVPVLPERVPNRVPAQVLRLWIAPWVDKDGHWHSGGVIMTDVYPRTWDGAVAP